MNNNENNLIESKISKEIHDRFLSYAMSVIISRALPLVNDGLKPVHRRILYAMHGLRLAPDKPYKKSARIVGEVIGKYHPHGDAAVYEAMTKMIQPFSCNYPLIDGHGNFGSIDGDSPAAMRYTEVRLSKIAWETLKDLEYDTVNFVSNYDGSEKEPNVLPGYIPNLLANGSLGIAVGMATSIPPHNLTEIFNSSIAYLKNPDITIEKLISKNIFLGPDFPTGAFLIIDKKNLLDYYSKGKGSFKLRAKYHIESEGNRNHIIIDEIPYQVNKAKLIARIAELVKLKKIIQISDLRDESNRLGIRIVITLKREAQVDVVLNRLFKLTPLQNNFAMNALALFDNKPEIMNLMQIIKYYVNHQINVLVRKTNHLLAVDQKKLFILEALKKALDNIDAVIKLVKESDTTKIALKNLQELLKIEEVQAKAILEMKLQRLTSLEQTKIINETLRLKEEIKEYQKILNDNDYQKQILISKLKFFKKKYGIERRTKIIDFDRFASIDEEDLILHKEMLICLTKNNYIKTVDIKHFREQHRGGVGVKGITLNPGDEVKNLLKADTRDLLLLFSNLGKVYRLKTWKIPDLGRVAKGTPVQNLLKITKEEKIESVIKIKPEEFQNDKYLFFVTRKGIVKKTKISQYASINRSGKIAISLKKGDHLMYVFLINDEMEVVIGKSNGLVNRFVPKNDVRPTGRSASGVIGTKLDLNDYVVMATTVMPNQKILTLSSDGNGKINSVAQYSIRKRGAKGVKALKQKKTVNKNKLVGVVAVDGKETLILGKTSGKFIRTNLQNVRTTKSRTTRGVKLVELDSAINEKISALTIFNKE